MPAAWIAPAGSTLPGRLPRILEAEIAFLVGTDLPPRPLGDRPAALHARRSAVAAMASCHPVIEVLETAFTDPTKFRQAPPVPPTSSSTDGFIYGPAVPNWQSIDWQHRKSHPHRRRRHPRRAHRLQHLRRPAVKPPPLASQRRRSPHQGPPPGPMDHHRLLDRQHPRHCRLRRRSHRVLHSRPRRPPLRIAHRIHINLSS